MLPATPEELWFLDWLARRGKAYVHKRVCRRYQLVDRENVEDMARTVVYTVELRNGPMLETPLRVLGCC